MQFVRGSDLAEQLAQRGAPYPLEQVLAWGDQVLDVLHYLHTLQPPIVHRDIKPQNIKLKADGTIMLLDFGLAKGFAGESPPSSTEGSLLAYTKGYAPPEQVEGTGTDARSDLYALGATLHCLATNVLPVEAAMRLLADARGRPDPLRPAHEINPAVPEAVSRLLEQALSLEPDLRPANAETMRVMLRAASSNTPPPAPPPPMPHTAAAETAAGAGSTRQPHTELSAPPSEANTSLLGRPGESTDLPGPPGEPTDLPGPPEQRPPSSPGRAAHDRADGGLPGKRYDRPRSWRSTRTATTALPGAGGAEALAQAGVSGGSVGQRAAGPVSERRDCCPRHGLVLYRRRMRHPYRGGSAAADTDAGYQLSGDRDLRAKPAADRHRHAAGRIGEPGAEQPPRRAGQQHAA